MATEQQSPTEPNGKKPRSKVSQADIPAYSLDEALRIPAAIYENYAGRPTEPIKIAKAMGLLPNSTQFRMLCGAATAYGLTDGGYRLEKISITALAKRIMGPISDAERITARREALLKPRITKQFLQNYNNSPLPPRPEIAYDMLVELGVPRDRVANVYTSIIRSSEQVGLITEIKNRKYVFLENPVDDPDEGLADEMSYSLEELEELETDNSTLQESVRAEPQKTATSPTVNSSSIVADDGRKRKVFITHGKNKDFLELIKKLLQFGELEPVISIERQSVSEPVPDKVLSEMRGCGAAIIHVDAEMKLLDSEAKEHIVLNPNVLIEIGAAMALYGRRFILLVKEGTSMPSNLQGLYEVRYAGNTLDGDTTVRLLEAINQMKKIELIS